MNQIRRLLPSSGIRSVFDHARSLELAGQQVLHLEIGRPEWPMPPGADQGARNTLSEGQVHYLANRGLIGLRQLIAADLKQVTGRSFDPETELIITIGASEAVCMCALVLLAAGDEIIIPQPAWNHYEAVASLAGAKAVPLELSAEEGFLLDPDKLSAAITKNTKMIVVNSPSNPTGSVQTADILKQIAKLALENNVFILADEVYRTFVYEGEHVSIANYMGDSELLLYADSFSKSMALSGWRVGFIASSERISDALNRAHQYLTVCGSPFAQQGVADALAHAKRQIYQRDMLHSFAQRRQVWLEALRDCPSLKLTAPQGAFYLFPRIDFRGMDGREFSHFMLTEHNVAMVPGDVFGSAFKQHVRISYGGDIDTQHKAAERIRNVLND